MTASSQTTNAAANGQGKVRLTPQHIVSRAPRDGTVLGQVPVATPLQIHSAMAEARLGQAAWQGIGLERRLLFVQALKEAMYRQRDRFLNTAVAEQGKVFDEAQLEFLATIELIEYYMQQAPALLAPEDVPVRLQPQRQFVIEREPYGVVLVIAPWNYPLLLSMGPIVAALITGNSVVYKPSEYATQIGEVFAAVIADAGIPDEVFHIVHGYGDVGAALIEAGPDRIVFTGSVPTGKKIAAAAAEKLIPVTLELGGKDAAIVLADADIDHAAGGIVWSGMFNAGQTCASVERVYVVESAAAPLINAMKGVITQALLEHDGSPDGIPGCSDHPGADAGY
jgi:acyl-CoA reductase-like NAD-dependent aldehyde dehydrogenase